MSSITQAVTEIIQGNFFFEFGLQNRIINFSQLSKLIQPLVQERVGKKVTTSSITMAISRIQVAILPKGIPHKLLVNDVSIKNNLCSLTYYNTQKNQDNISRLQMHCQNQDKFFARSDSNKEIGVILNQDFTSKLKDFELAKPKHVQKNIGAVIVSIPEDYLELKGMFQYFIQKVTMQNINIYEIGSTYTELIIYIAEEDLSLAANTFLNLQS